MRNKIVYQSSLSAEITGFINEKQAMGFKYIEAARLMRRFDKYWSSHSYDKIGLSSQNLADWCHMGDTEGAGSLKQKLSVIRQFSIYLNGIGLTSYVLPIKVKYEVPLPHIFTKSELRELFFQIDSYESFAYALSSKRIANEYPVLFRLIYHNGLRISEACKLATSEIDFEHGVITILDGKGNTERLIYLSQDMKMLCVEYYEYLCSISRTEPRWFFPGRKISDPIGISTVDSIFNIFLKKTTFVNNCSTKPTVHSLRHTYVVERINLWMEKGMNFEYMRPYLSKFLGHKTYNETYYYYHYVEEAAKTIHRMDTTRNRIIPEVMRR